MVARRVVRARTEWEWRRPWREALVPRSTDPGMPRLSPLVPPDLADEPYGPAEPPRPRDPQGPIPLTLTKNDEARAFYPDMPLRGQGDSWTSLAEGKPKPAPPPAPAAPAEADLEPPAEGGPPPAAVAVQNTLPLGADPEFGVAGDPGFRWSDMIPEEEVYRALVDKYNAATPQQKQWGHEWYDTANEYIRNVAQATGYSESKVAAVMAAFSPQTAWDPNMQQATYFLLNHDLDDPQSMERMRAKMPSIGANLDRAARIMAAGDDDASIEAALAGDGDTPKIRNFWKGLMGDRDAMTLDTWMARAMLGQHLDLGDSAAAQDVLNWAGAYDKLSAVARRAASDLGVDPRALQAIVWSQVNPSANYAPLRPDAWRELDEARTKRWTKSPMKKPMPDYTHGPGWRALPGPQLSGTPGYAPARGAARTAAGEPIYRGLTLSLPPAERRRITELFRSDPAAASEALLDLVAGGGGDEPTGGLGRHWSEDEQVARGFGRPPESMVGPKDPRWVRDSVNDLGVVLRGVRPAAGEDPDRTNSGYEHTPLPNERLVSLLPGTEVDVDGAWLGNVAPWSGPDGWTSADDEWHDLPARRKMRARKANVLPPGLEGPAEPAYDPSSAGSYSEPVAAPDGAEWYHVTTRRLSPGTQLVPGGKKSVFDEDGFYDAPDNQGRKRWVWMEHELPRMGDWVSEVESRSRARGRRARPLVYRVRPTDPPRPWEGHGGSGWVAGGAEVVGLVPRDELDAAVVADLERSRREQDEYVRSGQAAVDNAIFQEEARLTRIERGMASPEDHEGPDEVTAQYLPPELLGNKDAVRAAVRGIQKGVPYKRTARRPDWQRLTESHGISTGGPMEFTAGRTPAIRFELGPQEEGNWAYARLEDGHDGLGPGEPVSEICWDRDTGEVNWIQTRRDHRRRGVGRALFNWVRDNHQPDLRHSDDLSDDGRAFAHAVAALRAAAAALNR